MKKLKSILFYTAAAVFTLSSCGEEEGENGNGDGNTTGAPIVSKAGEITADETWTADNIYRLEGRVTVVSGTELTIEPGTIIKGAPGAGQFSSALLVARGATINAAGTADRPIIFTSVADDIQPGEINSPNLDPNNNGLWGGVIICGNAPISASANEIQIEGIPTSDANGLYGGNDEADNSGVFTYVSIRHGGTNIGAGNEINGLSLGGVGSGTTINNIEIVANQDDGIEWYGGNVSITNALVWNSGDDALDTDQDWIGSCENFVIVTPRGGSAFELDGPEGQLNRGCHSFADGVVYAGGDIDHLIDWDGGTNAGITNVHIFGVENDYVYIPDDPATTGEDEDEEFDPFESWGGDQNCNTANITIELGTQSLADMFNPNDNVPTALTESSSLPASVDLGAFSWTWARQSGALSTVGL
jgi:hypothetical protein